jgi:Ca-activated chloride channel homolog
VPLPAASWTALLRSRAAVGIVLLAAGLIAVGQFVGCAIKPRDVTPIPGGEGRHIGAIPGSLSSRDDELWVISRSISDNEQSDWNTPGSGAMMARPSETSTEVPVPLKHTDVRAFISGYIATVEVTQQFYNPFDGKIEAVYVFPLPHDAAVNEFLMTIGRRRIRGIIRERQEAQRIYQDARRQGYVATLLTEERPNIFTQSVANLEPGKEIEVNIKYFHTLAYVDGWYEFVFPMVVGPRYNPPGTTNGIGAVARGRAGASAQPVELQYSEPGARSGHDISLRVEVDAGVAIEESLCRTHRIGKQSPAPEQLVVALDPADRIPNRDFVLRYRVAGERIKSKLMTCRDERGGYFTYALYPPEHWRTLDRQPLELVFVLDCSGSMSGRPLEQAKAAIEQALRRLQPGDTFQLIRFSNDASQLGPVPLAATPTNVGRGLDHLRALNSEGGTMMIEGIKAALDFPHDSRRLRFVCFLTDGFIGNEAEILGEIHRRLGSTRIFSFGAGSSVNRYLLEQMAKLGQGAVAYLGPNDNAAGIMNDFFDRISHPALTDVRIDWAGAQVAEVLPQKIPDLFVGRPVILTGRFTGNVGPIRVSGKAAGQPIAFDVTAKPDESNAACRGMPRVWARMKIADLAERMIWEPGQELPAQIRQVALDYGLISDFTAFVAVDSTRRTDGREGTTVPVAVPVPDGVKYETTVNEN